MESRMKVLQEQKQKVVISIESINNELESFIKSIEVAIDSLSIKECFPHVENLSKLIDELDIKIRKEFTGSMTNIERGIEITGRSEDDLKNNECPRSLGIVTKTCTENDCDDCWEEKFVALRKPSLPEGYQCIEHDDIDEVYYSDKEVLITGRAKNGHNCDSTGCTSVSHVIFRMKIKKE